MKPCRLFVLMILIGVLFFGMRTMSWAGTVYVDGLNGNDSNPGTGWDKAKRTISAGVNSSIGGDTVLVAAATCLDRNRSGCN